MSPITAAPPSLPLNAPPSRSVSLPVCPRPISPHSKRRSASVPPMTLSPPTPSSRHRPTFHLAVDASDPEPDSRSNSTHRSGPHTAPPLLVSDREAARRHHALSELLSTELGYLLDLRILVSVSIHPSFLVSGINSSKVYIRLLPVLKYRSSAHGLASSSNPTIAYFSRPPSLHGIHSLRTQSHPHLSGSTCLVTLTHPDESDPSGPAYSHSIPVRVEKCTTRHLFSASDLDVITRNAEEILGFHERLVRQLRHVVSPFGISISPPDILTESSAQSHSSSPKDLHRAINAVSTVFVDHVRSPLSSRPLF